MAVGQVHVEQHQVDVAGRLRQAAGGLAAERATPATSKPSTRATYAACASAASGLVLDDEHPDGQRSRPLPPGPAAGATVNSAPPSAERRLDDAAVPPRDLADQRQADARGPGPSAEALVVQPRSSACAAVRGQAGAAVGDDDTDVPSASPSSVDAHPALAVAPATASKALSTRLPST